MLPFSLVVHLEREYYIHGIPHPAPFFPLTEKFIKSVKENVETRITHGEAWFCESGLDLCFGISGITPLWDYPLERIMELPPEPQEEIGQHMLEYFQSLRRDMHPRQIFAEQMTDISQLSEYRKMFVPSLELASDIFMYNQGRMPLHYSDVIERSILEKQHLLTKNENPIHFLTGIAHEYVLRNINW
jgi:hypothetical protein